MRLLENALRYAVEFGIPVLPLHSARDGNCTCGAKDCIRAGKHPRTTHGVKDATTDSKTIQEWWKRWPDANIGGATGERSGITVLDVDPRNGGDESLSSLEDQHGKLPPTWVSQTGGGGSHRFFKYVPGLKNSSGRIAPGVDLKTDGGYVILPLSLHVSGRRYAWQDGSQPGECQVASMPPWLIQLAQDTAEDRSSAPSHPNGRFPVGRRNSTLASLAGTLRRDGMCAEDIFSELSALNERSCEQPLQEEEVRRIAMSIGRYETALKAPGSVPHALRVSDIPSIFEIESSSVSSLVEGLLFESTVNLLTGDAGIGKTTLALAIAGAVSRGEEFAGRRTKSRPVLVLDRENPLPVVIERLQRFLLQDGDRLRIWGGWLSEEAPDPGSEVIRDWVRTSKPPPLIVVDSLIAFHPGAENDSGDTRQYLHRYRELANMGATILLLHHSGKAETAKEYRGSSDIKAAVDAAYQLIRIGNDSGRLGGLRLRGFKNRFLGDVDIRLRIDASAFVAESTSDRQGKNKLELFSELLVENPGIKSREFEDRATGSGLGRNSAREFLRAGVKDETVKIEIGPNRAKLHTWVGDASREEPEGESGVV